VCIAVSALSTALPSTLTYDSWSWLTWGRELEHLRLDTSGFVAVWKPLPVIAAAIYAPAGRLAPVLWLVTARAGGLVAVAVAYRLARRVGGTGAGLVAALALLLSAGFTGYLLPLGMSEPLLAGIALCALERHLDDRHLHAWVLVWVASLLRPEAWPFLGIYALRLWREEPRHRALTATLVFLLPVLWFVPDLLGAGDAFRSLHRAEVPTQGGPQLGPSPGLALLGTASRYLLLPFSLGALVAVTTTADRFRRRRRGDDQTTPAILVVAGVWLIIEVVTTQAGTNAGDQRYLIVAAAGAAVLAGIGWARTVEAAGWVVRRRAGEERWTTVVQAVACLVLMATTVPFVLASARQARTDVLEIRYQQSLYRQLPAVVRALGGRDRVVACGQVYAGFYQAPAVAWQLRLPLGDVLPTTAPIGATAAASASPSRAARALARWAPTVARAPGTVLDAPATRNSRLSPAPPAIDSGLSNVISVGHWRAMSSCPPDSAAP